MPQSVVFNAQHVRYLSELKKILSGLTLLLNDLTVLRMKSNAMDVVLRRDLFFVSKIVKYFHALRRRELIFVG
jgi:hypothetical protein